MAPHAAPPVPLEPTKASPKHDVDSTPPPPASPPSPMSPSAEKAPTVHYEHDIEKLNSAYQLAWIDAMQHGFYSSSTDYERVHVLMLSWADQYDDLKVRKEINELKGVFEDVFHYHVLHECLKNSNEKPTQQLVNKIVANWVFKYDNRKTLLIVYFAGHGRPGKNKGDLQLSGKRSLMELQSEINQVTWNCAEGNLLNTFADVLQIFDCCYAGSLGHRGPSTAFEYLAACGPDQTTPPPGESSFTRALIWALKELHGEMRLFTTSHLCRKIREAEYFPRDQKPDLHQRDNANQAELIVLQPLQPGGAAAGSSSAVTDLKASAPPLSPGLSRNAARQYVLTLKYVFETRPTEANIRDLGMSLNTIVQSCNLHVNRIMWGGLVPRQNDAVFRAINRFKNNVRRSHSQLINNETTRRLFSSIKQANGSPKTPTAKSATDPATSPQGCVEIKGSCAIHGQSSHEQLRRQYRMKNHMLITRAIWAFAFIALLFSLFFSRHIFIIIGADETWSSRLKAALFVG